MNSIPLKILNSIAFVIMVTVNFLANVLPLGIGSTGDVSEKYPNLFTPRSRNIYCMGPHLPSAAGFRFVSVGTP